MFNSLSEKLESAFKHLKGQARINELNVANTLKDIRKALSEPVTQIINAVKATLDRTPPELASDLMQRGIVLTGGGALLKGLDDRLRHETGMPIHVSERPLQAVAEGSGKCVEEFEALEKVLISEPRR